MQATAMTSTSSGRPCATCHFSEKVGQLVSAALAQALANRVPRLVC